MSIPGAHENDPSRDRRGIRRDPALRGKRVLMLLATALYPFDVRVRREATTLTAAGYQVYVICPRYTQRAWQPWQEVLEGVRVIRYPTPLRRFDLIGYLWGYAYSPLVMLMLSIVVWLRWGFDIVHAHNPPDNLALVAAFFKPFGKRFVFDQHDLAPEMYEAVFPRGRRVLHNLLSYLERLSYTLADHVIVTNESYRALAISRGRVDARRLTIVRNGPDLSILHPVEPFPRYRSDGRVVIGYVGAIGLHDGVECLLRALWHLANDYGRRDFTCVLVGGGRRLARMKLMSDELGLQELTEFVGWVDHAEVARYLSSFDICVAPEPSNPYNDRSTVIKIGEYMALARPVVAFDLPEHRYTAQDAAVYARPNDENDFAGHLAMLMDDPELREKMGSAGLGRVRAELAWHHQARALLSAYDVLGRRV